MRSSTNESQEDLLDDVTCATRLAGTGSHLCVIGEYQFTAFSSCLSLFTSYTWIDGGPISRPTKQSHGGNMKTLKTSRWLLAMSVPVAIVAAVVGLVIRLGGSVSAEAREVEFRGEDGSLQLLAGNDAIAAAEEDAGFEIDFPADEALGAPLAVVAADRGYQGRFPAADAIYKDAAEGMEVRWKQVDTVLELGPSGGAGEQVDAGLANYTLFVSEQETGAGSAVEYSLIGEGPNAGKAHYLLVGSDTRIANSEVIELLREAVQ